MPRLIVHTFSVSIDGFGAGPGQGLGHPLGVGGEELFDEQHLAISPVLLGHGEHLLGGIDLPALGYECVEHRPGERASAHVVLRKVS